MLRCAARAGLPSARLGRRRPSPLTSNANRKRDLYTSPVLPANVRLCDGSWSPECSHQLRYGSRGLSSFSRFLRERGSPDALPPTSRDSDAKEYAPQVWNSPKRKTGDSDAKDPTPYVRNSPKRKIGKAKKEEPPRLRPSTVRKSRDSKTNEGPLRLLQDSQMRNNWNSKAKEDSPRLESSPIRNNLKPGSSKQEQTAKEKDVHLTQAVPTLDSVAAVYYKRRDECKQALEAAREARETLGNVPVNESIKSLLKIEREEVAGRFGQVIQKACDIKLWPISLELLDEMREAGGAMTPHLSHFTLVLECLHKSYPRTKSKKKFHDVFRGIFHEMAQKEVDLSNLETTLLHRAFNAYASDPSYWTSASYVFKLLRSRLHDVEDEGAKKKILGGEHYARALQILVQRGRLDRDSLAAFMRKMQLDGMQADGALVEKAVRAAVEQKKWFIAALILEEMSLAYDRLFVTYQTNWDYIEALVRQYSLRKAYQKMKRIQYTILDGEKPTVTLDTHALKCLIDCTGVTAEASTGFIVEMAEHGVTVHPDSYAVAINHANKCKQSGTDSPKLAMALFENMLENGHVPNLDVIHAAIMGCDSIQEALMVAAKMPEYQLKRNAETYSSLLHACCKRGGGQSDGTAALVEEANRLWAEMLEEGIAVDGEVLAPYVKAIMLGGDCEQAIGVRKRYRKADDESKIRKDLGFLETPVGGKVGRTRAVLDSIVCEGLVNNGKAEEAIEELFYALQMIPTAQDMQPSDLLCLDEYNGMLLTGIRACAASKLPGTWAMAVEFLEMVETRWAMGPGVEGGHADWRVMSKVSRASRRSVYDQMVTLLDQQGAPQAQVRKVLERGLRNGSVLLLRDSGSRYPELALELQQNWGPESARVVLRCILEDVLQDEDFFVNNTQYALAEHVHHELLREFGPTHEWFSFEGPQMKGRRRLYLDGGLNPVRHDERRGYNASEWDDREDAGIVIRDDRDRVSWPKFDQEYWYRRASMNTRTGEARLTISTELESRPGTVRSELQRFALEGVVPSLALNIDVDNKKKCLVLRSSVVRYWAASNPSFVEDGQDDDDDDGTVARDS